VGHHVQVTALGVSVILGLADLGLELSVRLLQGIDHGIEGAGELAHEIDALGEIAPRDLLGLPGEMPEIGLKLLEGSGQVVFTRNGHVQVAVGQRFDEGARLAVNVDHAVHLGRELVDLVARLIIDDDFFGEPSLEQGVHRGGDPVDAITFSAFHTSTILGEIENLSFSIAWGKTGSPGQKRGFHARPPRFNRNKAWSF